MSVVSQFDTCSKCGSVAEDGVPLQRCSRCKLALYCDKKCQTTAWKGHKRVCKALPPSLKLSNPEESVKATRLLGGYNRPFYPRDTVVPPSHPVWTTGAISPISQIVGVPLLIHREVEEQSLSDPSKGDKDNQAVTYLMIDPETGLAPARWQKNIGPVTIVRADHKHLSPVALEMIWMFCDEILERFGDEGTPPLSKYRKEEFDEFCRKYQEEYVMNNIRADEISTETLPL
ncbi:hypothetical protein BDY19DRAFT_960091 [Irpex rosettiformis]|uniref:Uncharacterized protein n=1 Tax=Irpex rosettiformis TaxID=378272 RepID=A0ACB8TWZ2_9APHY|nr:hypothetical protein BDY19DRAFT_960091 [Irpex rosettiformis]